MKIKRLEIAGFKSFVEKTVFDFQQGVTAIVGPNGCGKSNVVDAIRWVMGEQSAKNLRGRQMEDVIFGGSESRKPLGMAEVSLVFSTEDGRVPAKYLAFSEVQVTRRLYRDGESDYLLNKTPCRLMDISELFMDTGVGAKAYSIIEQGRIGMILHAKPEDRRFLIEEAAGVTKFKVRKQVALKKIDITRQNLVRLADIIGEIRRQLGSLQRQAKRAERFRLLREELRGVELLLIGRELLTLKDEFVSREYERGRYEAELASVTTSLVALDVEGEAHRCQQLELERRLAALQEESYRSKGEVQAAEERLESSRRELAALERQVERASAELSLLDRQNADSREERSRLCQQIEGIVADNAEHEKELLGRQQEVDRYLQEEGEILRELEARRRSLFVILSDLSQATNRKQAAEKRMAALLEQRERQSREARMLDERLKDATAQLAASDERRASTLRERGVAGDALVKVRADEEACRQRLARHRETLQTHREQLAATVSRLTSLRELEQQFAGYDRGVKFLLTAQQFAGRFAGVLADVVETDPAHEQAVEAALGHRLQHLVPVDGEQQLQDTVTYLKGSEGGRCGFLVGGGERLSKAVSTFPCLLGLLKAPPRFMHLIRPLLATTYLVPDLTTALDSARLHPDATFVTAEGELVSPGGVLTVGAAESGGGLIHKRREMRQLEGQRDGLAIQVSEVEEQLRTSQLQLEQYGQESGRLGQELHRLEMQLLTLEKDGARFRDECARIQEQMSLCGLEDKQLGEERDALVAEGEKVAAVILELEATRNESEKGVEECQLNSQSLRANLELARERLTSLRVTAAALKEKHESIQAAVVRIDEHLAESARRESRHREDLLLWARQQQDIASAITLGEAEVRAKLACIADQDVAVQSLRQSVEATAERVREQERLIRLQRDEDVRLRQFLADGGIRLAELKGRQNQLDEFLAERYRLTAEEVMAATETTSDQGESLARQQELKRLIDDLGEVNLAALDEYRQLEERHGFLVSQKADLEDSLQELQRAIGTINRTTRKRFLETFTQVNERFRTVFPRLFCGGSAELRLTNEDDLLETGIDIIVQPPGKKLQNVSLLSGGEKALTAVALIFSIFLIKPSPFCLLDEVDAPLDEANIGRFNEMVREMSRTSQFIMITHSKATMGMADTLYGVTMEEPGVSRVVSVRLNEGGGG